MKTSDSSALRFQMSHVRGAWVMAIYNGEHTKNRSFRIEIDALASGATPDADITEKPSRISAGGSGRYGYRRLE